MRPELVAWLLRHGLPGWIAPDYFHLVAIGTLAGAALTLLHTRRDHASTADAARTIAFAYVAALAGGYVFEALRHLPAAVAAGSLAPLTQGGRAAWGGLLGAVLAAFVDLRLRRQPVGAFLDRTVPGAGLVFFAVRGGCFLAGCDYGVPTALPVGVRFPPGSLAALDHARRGWIAAGAPSLPVHPTQLYEAAVALVASIFATLLLLRRAPRRDGAVFATWLGLYAGGRFLVELLRGDVERGGAFGLSTAQIVSLVVLSAIVFRRLTPDPTVEESGNRPGAADAKKIQIRCLLLLFGVCGALAVQP